MPDRDQVSNPPPPLDPAGAARSGMLLAIHARATPERDAVIAPAGSRSFADLNANANRLARRLRQAGLGAGDAIGLVCSNRPELAETLAAAARSGLRLTPVNWHLTAQEIAYVLDNCEARAVVADARFADAVAAAAAGCDKLAIKLAVGGPIAGFEDYAQALASQAGDDLGDPVAGSTMLYTSGTTGKPKGVYRRPAGAGARAGAAREGAGARGGAGAAAGAAAAAAALRYGPGDSHLCTGPLYHAAPLAFSLQAPLNQGACVVMMDGWDPEECLRLIERHRVTHTHMVPTMFHRLLALPEEQRAGSAVDSLRVVLHGAAPCPVPVKRAMIEWLGPVVYEYYAATEGWGSFVTSETWLQKPGTVGQPAPGQVKVAGPDGAALPPNEVGTIYLRAPEGGRFEYYRDRAKTDSAYDSEGAYFTLGDVGYLDEDGYLFLSDRSADVIISGGVNVYPAEVDAVLLTHPAVGDAATIGVPSEEWGESVRSVVELQAGVAPTPALELELIDFCRERLAHFKCPRGIDFTDALPRHDTGKIYRRLVRETYWAGRDRQI